MENRFWKEFDEEETLERLKIETETEKLRKVNKIEGHEIRTESRKDTTKRETEELRIERINKLNKREKIKTVIEELRIEIKFNELANNLDIRLIKRTKNSTFILEYYLILLMEKILK